jgi:hypothetical protein
VTHAPKNGEEEVLWALQAAWPNEVPGPQLSRICLGYGRAIHTLRHKKGWLITNRVEIVNGKKHGFFRLGSKPIPSSAELRKSARPSPEPAPVSDSLFGDISPERYPD